MNRREIDQLPGLKRKDLQACFCCGHGVGKSGITFYRVKLERFILDAGAIQQRHGLEMMLGGGVPGAVLAGVMGPDQDLAKLFAGPWEFLVCEDCGLGGMGDGRKEPLPCLAECAERLEERKPKQGGDGT